MTSRRSARIITLLVALVLAALAPVAAAHAFPRGAAVLIEAGQTTGGSFGGSAWGGGSSRSNTGSSGPSRSDYGTSSGYGGSSGYGSGGRHHDGGSGDFFALVIAAFSVHPLLGLAVLAIGLCFWLFSSRNSR